MLEIKDVSFSYGKQQIVRNVSLSLLHGEIVGLIGENGVGKTTLMKVISGIYKPDQGKISIKSERIGMLIEYPCIYDNLSVFNNMEFFRNLYNESKARMEEIMKIIGIWGFRKKSAKKLSLGMKQRLGVAIALLASTEVVLLDEPTNGLDPSGILDLLNAIKKFSELNDTTFMISSHIFQNLEDICKDIYIIHDCVLEDIYNIEGKYTHSISLPRERYNQVVSFLKQTDTPYQIGEDNNICVSNLTDNKEFIEELNRMDAVIQKRRLQEVYFE